MKGVQWNELPAFWNFTLKDWTSLNISHGSENWKRFVQVMPLWNNTHFVFGKLRRPWCKMNADTIHTIKALGFNRLQDWVDHHGSYLTKELLDQLLNVEDFTEPRFRTGLINDTVKRFSELLPDPGPYHGPTLPAPIQSACHDWALDDKPVIQMTNRDFVVLLLKSRKNQKTPTLPLAQLGLPNVTLPEATWNDEHGWDRHVLPVCADVKFRLQHNALGVRYKFKYRTEVDTPRTCIHDCADIETAIHLFWECPVAQYQWEFYLPPFRTLIDGVFAWNMVVFPSTISLRTTAIQRYGDSTIRAAFTMVRCCVIRSLWLHRNKRLYNPETSTSASFVQHHVLAYVKLHLRKFEEHAVRHGRIKAVRLARRLSRGLQDIPSSNSIVDSSAWDPATANGAVPTPGGQRSTNALTDPSIDEWIQQLTSTMDHSSIGPSGDDFIVTVAASL
ncbi:hypothetical protein PRIC1_009954 [Phytophthora ramorum]